MELLQEVSQYTQSHLAELWGALGEHLLLVAIALAISMAVCIPLGVWTARSKAVSAVVLNTFNALRVIPSIAVLFLAIPVWGLSFTSAVIALTLLAFPPVLVNTDAAYRTIDPAIRESAKGMGMTTRQILWRVETPLALPIIVAGIRTAATEVIASATLAAFIGIGGWASLWCVGFALYDISILLVGAVPVALLALTAEIILEAAQRKLQPPA
jgi:osmoprotectant transport system permease protein